MPHAIVKMVSGRTDAQKGALAEAVTEAIRTSLGVGVGVGLDSISVAIEDVPKAAWTVAVYDPDIAGKPDTIFKPPGYGRA